MAPSLHQYLFYLKNASNFGCFGYLGVSAGFDFGLRFLLLLFHMARRRVCVYTFPLVRISCIYNSNILIDFLCQSYCTYDCRRNLEWLFVFLFGLAEKNYRKRTTNLRCLLYCSNFHLHIPSKVFRFQKTFPFNCACTDSAIMFATTPVAGTLLSSP